MTYLNLAKSWRKIENSLKKGVALQVCSMTYFFKVQVKHLDLREFFKFFISEIRNYKQFLFFVFLIPQLNQFHMKPNCLVSSVQGFFERRRNVSDYNYDYTAYTNMLNKNIFSKEICKSVLLYSLQSFFIS